jgi:thiamine biosynthesis lipoprotein
MSFHEADSDVSNLNRDAHDWPVRVHPHTFEVLRLARELSEASHGCFDITVASRLVDWGFLPPPVSRVRPDPQSDWRDVELRNDRRVRFRRPLWIDLGGIAKGYAVDQAMERLLAHGVAQASVNAGGDLRVCGPATERVSLRLDSVSSDTLPIIEIDNGSVASSSSLPESSSQRNKLCGPHIDGRRGRPVGKRSFVAVVAERCVIADALTKTVLALGKRSENLLQRYSATAYLYTLDGWRSFGPTLDGGKRE